MKKFLPLALAAALLAPCAQAHDPAPAAEREVVPPVYEDRPWPRASGDFPRYGIHVGSQHAPRIDRKKREYNNLNPGLSVRWANGATLGFYRNSIRRWTTYGGWTWTNSACGPALTVGVITGYRRGAMAMAVPSICVMEHVRFLYIPRMEPKGAHVLHLALEF